MQFLFGINFVASKIIVTAFHPLQWALIRFLVAGILLWFAALLFNPRISGRGWDYFGKIFGLALMGISLSQVLFLGGIGKTSAVNAAILTSTIPIFTMMIVLIKKQEKLTWYKVLGLLCAFTGVLFIRNIQEVRFSNATFLGDLMVLASAICTAIFISFSRPFFKLHDSWWATIWMFLVGGVQVLAVISFVSLPSWRVEMSELLIGSMLFAIIGATITTYFASNWALSKTSSGNVALFIYLQPVVTIFFAWAAQGEAITIRALFSCLLILTGFTLALKGKTNSSAG